MLEMQLHAYPAAFDAFARGLCLYPDDSHLLLGAALTEMRLNEVLNANVGVVRVNARVQGLFCLRGKWGPLLTTFFFVFLALSPRTSTKVDSARELFRRAVRADAKHAHAWQAWGVFESKQSNLRAARTLFEAGLRECPDHCALWQVTQ